MTSAAAMKLVYRKRIQIWLDALRNGGYKQSRLKYHGSHGGHCCLGVGQIVCALPLEESAKKLCNHLGLTPKEIDKLIGLNDAGHRSFAYIANHIAKNILPRFA